jgi:predicted CXXCH cytochrome family protein
MKSLSIHAMSFCGARSKLRAFQMARRQPGRFWRLVPALALLSFASTVPAQDANSIVSSKHNLSVSSPGNIHATTESEICIFCHTPHFATGDGPLWNHQMSTAQYTPYTSSSMKVTPGQPTGSSRLCLSCHDGTVALGGVNSRQGGIAMNTATLSSTSDSLSTDLSHDHPISFTYDTWLASADGNLRNPQSLPQAVHLEAGGKLECTACHDPHNDQYGNFLVMDNTGSALCLACHNIINWPTSPHALSAAPLPAVLLNLMSTATPAAKSRAETTPRTVGAAACASCHVPHKAGSKEELTRFADPEKNCVFCHSAGGPGQNVMSDFNQVSVHPIYINSQSHTPQEDPVNPPLRHVTCVDCHNPHGGATSAGAKSAGVRANVAASLAGVTGVSAGGAVIHSITHEYELCFRCHGDSAARGPAKVPRQVVETNTRRQFNPGNVSFHPIEAVGKNPAAPSLLQPLTPSTLLGCGDCHASENGPGNGGNGATGPHGSAYAPLLERMLLFTDGTPYNPNNFALCYKCHSSTVVDSSLNTSWAQHQKHIENYRAACTTCHDSHAAAQPHLINFNTEYVMPYNGIIRYTSLGANHGTCTLTCHDGTGQNHPHNNTSY